MIVLFDATIVVLPIVCAVAGLLLGAAIIFFVPVFKKQRANKNAQKIIRDAEIKAEHIAKNAQLDGKQVVFEMKQEANKEIHERKQEVINQENKLSQREQNIDRRDAALIQKETSLEQKNEVLNRRLKDVDKKEADLQEKIDSIIGELEKVAQMSTQDAKNELMQRVESKISMEIATYIKSKEEEAKETVNEKARELLSQACAKYAQEVTTERTVSVVTLPSDEMKGRIIGREGRNIHSLETLLGVDLIIDDTPEVITVSCFNPIRREVANSNNFWCIIND